MKSKNTPRRLIALLRGINVTGRNKVPMVELRSLCVELGWRDVQTYIQSGNVLFAAAGAPATLEDELERAIKNCFGLSIPVVVRTTTQWRAYVQANPLSEIAAREPNRLLLALSKRPPQSDALQALRARAEQEEIVQVGDALYIHYAAGVGRSKLTPALLDRLVGSPVTARNWRTVLKLAELSGDSAGD